MARSRGFQQQRQAYIKQGCPPKAPLASSHPGAYAETTGDFLTGNGNYTQAQVGGYVGNIQTSDGVTRYSITNIAGMASFTGESTWGKYLGMKSNAWDNPFGTNGPGHNVKQTFKWSEPVPCR